MSAAKYMMVRPGDGRQAPTIIDASTGGSILAIDYREVGGTQYVTPVFADAAIAARVLAMLNGDSA